MDVDAWTLVFVRGVLSAPGLFVFFLVMERTGWQGQLRAMGLAGVIAALLFALDNVMFIYSITHTSVANTLLMISLSPLFAALLTHIVLRQMVPRRTWLAIGGATVATLVILLGSLVTGDLPGTLAGLVAAIAIGGTLVVLRSRPSLNLVPAVALGAGLAGLIALPLASPGSADSRDWVMLVLVGLLIVPVAFGLIATGPRYIPAPEVALLLLQQTVLGALRVLSGRRGAARRHPGGRPDADHRARPALRSHPENPRQTGLAPVFRSSSSVTKTPKPKDAENPKRREREKRERENRRDPPHPAGPSPSHHLLRSERVPLSPGGSAPELIPVPVPSTSYSWKPVVFVTAGQYGAGL